MARIDPKNPLMWYLVQIVEYLATVLVLGRAIPASTPRWFQVAVFALVVAGMFALNFYVVMPKIGRSSRSDPDGVDPPR